MNYEVNYEGIERYWIDDYYFCEDKILANISNFFGCGHELMFAGGFNFGYQRGDERHGNIGSRITVKYFQERELLEKYYGVEVHKYSYEYGVDAFLEKCKSELSEGRPVAVGLQNVGVWPVKVGEEDVKLLPFMIVGVKEDDSVEVIDSHELGIRRIVSKETFRTSYRWGVTFRKKFVIPISEISIKEFIQFILDTYHNTVTAEHGCVDVDLSFSSISSNMDMFETRKTEDPYKEMLMLAEDVLTMDLEQEVQGLGGALWVPFYFALLLLYRSRLVFTKALCQVAEYKQTSIFQNVISRLIVSSSKWNYLRMVFTNCYHNNKLDHVVKENMSSVIREIAEHEKQIIEEFKELYEKCDMQKDTYDVVMLPNYFNAYLFDHKNWESIDESKAVYGRYFYEGKVPEGKFAVGDMYFYYPKANDKGDSIVCLGQRIAFDEAMQKEIYRSICLCGTVLYNEMIYDYMDILYTDGTKESICIGFDGWIENEYRFEKTGTVMWRGKVVKRENNEATDERRRAIIYGKRYTLTKGKEVAGICLPNNPFINILAISLEKQ